ncbi:YpmS family protein [Shouchella clausii]|uniref:YpmS family protein n=1 Tax=Shouchella clausii TaxID=79880 RepID=UPI000BA66BD2|nr:YpmS family protein [Shouchella clausii]MEB5479092.1 YpmS family protein [Shouchella clausii]MED4157026.1 YpmS family protein [Shouchella clausii]MED4177231.1 YpmS family protein [Shouchella clausii]PAD12848.1 hypothetical protein CHH74_13530 [Shouchella clausii]
MQQQRVTQTDRFYKVGFFVAAGLFVLLVTVFIVFFIYLFAGSEEGRLPATEQQGTSGDMLSIQLNRDQMNMLLADLTKSGEDVPFAFHLAEDGVYLTGAVDVFIGDVDLSMRFAPEVREDGSLLLKAEHLNAGALQISPAYALRIFSQLADLPEWVTIYPSEESVLLHPSEIKATLPYGLRFNKVDLAHDEIELSLVRSNSTADK